VSNELSQAPSPLQEAAAPAAVPSALSTPSVNPLATPTAPATPLPIPMRPAGQLGTEQEAPQMPLESTIPGSRTSVEAPLSFAQKIARAADKLAIPNKPGGWAVNLVGAAQHALSGVQDTLGDAATAAGQARPGEGALAAIGHIQNAKNARIQAQQKAQTDDQRDQALIAKTNVDTHMQETLLHSLKGKMADAANDAAISNGKVVFDALTQGDTDHGVPGAPVIARDISEAQAMNALSQKDAQGNPTWNPAKESLQATGKEPVYENGKQKLDEDGNPMWAKRYSIVGVPARISLGPEQVKFLTDNHVLKSDGKPWDAGQEMDGAIALSQFQQAHNNHALEEKQKDEATAAGLAEQTRDQKQASLDAIDNLGNDFFHVVAQADGHLSRIRDFVTGKHMIPDPTGKNPKGIVDPKSADFAKNHPTAEQDIINWQGGLDRYNTVADNQNKEDLAARTLAEKERHDQESEDEKRAKDLADKVTDVGGVLTDDMKAQMAALPPDRRAVLDKYPTKAGSLLAVALGPGDIDFKSIYSMRPTKGSNDLSAQNALNAILAINPNWSEQQYGRMHEAYKDITQGKEGIQVGQYNNVLQHAAGLQDVMDESARGKTPAFLNTAINALESKGWGAEAAKINTEVEAVKGEYELLMSAGYKPSEAEQAVYNKIANGSATPGQIGAFTKTVGSVGAVRLEQINEQYKRIAGRNLPGILTQETVDAAKHLNLDSTAMRRLGTLDVGDTIFHNQNYKAPTPTQVQQKDHEKLGQQIAADAAQQAATGNVTVNPNAGAGGGQADFFGNFGGKGR
jgi:hypothetical protein